MNPPPQLPRATDWINVFGTANNLPDSQIMHNRLEAHHFHFMRTVVAADGGSADRLAKLDRLVALNLTLARVGEKPLCHADLIVMWHTAMEINKLKAELIAAGAEPQE
ncbi:hypothetical protein L5515_018514 [Caenorhabditis briggsae]|uniref:Uncharacterized protein n=1 Tax=Caenorhabditis briggsae TaxID=6238 RepID=A0AAE9JUC0_CAEBR|nr:hypothetical protein L5515_018514 [Caenorhabditis briggsae]